VHALGWIGMPLREALTALHAGADHRARQALGEQVGRVLGKGSDSAVAGVEYASPPLAILERARDLGPDAVVLGATDPPGAGGYLSGTTLRVAAAASQPVLVLREPFSWPPRSVLCPVEEPDGCDDGLRRACEWLHRACPAPSSRGGRDPSMELLVVDVADRLSASPDRAAALARAARRVCGRNLRVTGIQDPRHGRSPAAPAEQVLDWAGRNGVDLVLLHRRGDDSTPLQDRTWYQVLLRAPCPVCLLPEVAEAATPPAAAAGERARAPEDDVVLAVGS